MTGESDPRQFAPELAAWLVASIAALAVPGVSALAYFEESGPRGFIDADGARSPAAEAFVAAAGLEGSRLLWGASPDGLIWATGSGDVGDTHLLLANLDSRPRTIEIELDGSTTSIPVDALSWRSVEVP